MGGTLTLVVRPLKKNLCVSSLTLMHNLTHWILPSMHKNLTIFFFFWQHLSAYPEKENHIIIFREALIHRELREIIYNDKIKENNAHKSILIIVGGGGSQVEGVKRIKKLFLNKVCGKDIYTL